MNNVATRGKRRGGLDLKKADKRKRIREAAHALFSKHGYDETTTRMIARRAGVANGTISLYARDKRDLVLLVFNYEIARTLDRAFAAAHKKHTLLDKLIAYCRVMYKANHDNLALSRIHLQLNHYSTGMHSVEYYGQRKRVSDFLEASVREAQRVGEIATDKDPVLIARLLFFVHSAAVRWWAASVAPDPQLGIKELSKLFALQLSGFRPSEEPSAAPKRTHQTAPEFETA